MSLYRRRGWTQQAQDLIPPRGDMVRHGSVSVTNETALRHSAVWACLRLRADLLSTMPLDAYRSIGGVDVEVPKPLVLRAPGGAQCNDLEWLYGSTVDLDRAGNFFGLITVFDGAGRPACIEMQPLSEVTVRVRGGRIVKYRIGNVDYEPERIWHERQFTLSGIPIGLSPVAYAAWSIGAYLSEQEFVLDWFQDGTVPAAMLKNTEKTIKPNQASEIKARFKSAVRDRDLFVTGSDWDYQMIQATAAQPQFIEAMQYGLVDICRFFGAPADLIDAAVSGSSVTYANISQRNLQFLIMNLGPMIARRERALSDLLAAPRFVKFDTDSLLRLDPQTRAAVIKTRIDARTLAPSEARAYDNLPPFTDDQLAEFDRLFGAKASPPQKVS